MIHFNFQLIHFEGGEYVPCFISGQTASGLPHGRTHNTDTDIFTFEVNFSFRLMMKWVCLSWSQCQVGEVEEEEQYAIDHDLMLVVQSD